MKTLSCAFCGIRFAPTTLGTLEIGTCPNCGKENAQLVLYPVGPAVELSDVLLLLPGQGRITAPQLVILRQLFPELRDICPSELRERLMNGGLRMGPFEAQRAVELLSELHKAGLAATPIERA
jgi:hypothetical protein